MIVTSDAATSSNERESFAKTSAMLLEVVEKAGQVILWDACKLLGWSINKGAKVSSKMAENGDIFVTDRKRNGRAIRILSLKPLPEQPSLDDWASKNGHNEGIRDMKIKVQSAIIDLAMTMNGGKVKEYLGKYFDFSDITDEALDKMRFGASILDIAARKLGYAGGIVDPKLKELLTRQAK